MTPAEFRAARTKLGLTQWQIGALIPSNRGGFTDGRTVRSWESGKASIPLHVPAVVVGLLHERLKQLRDLVENLPAPTERVDA